MTSRAERVKALTDKLEQGVQEVFSSGQYQAWLNTLAKFHRYSFNNVLLIQMQRPGATCVAGFQAWKKKFGRTVKRGEKGISILAPCPLHPVGGAVPVRPSPGWRARSQKGVGGGPGLQNRHGV